MDDAAWTKALDDLTPRERFLVQLIMARVSYVLNQDRILEIGDFQNLEDKAMNQQRQIMADETRQDDTDARLDHDEAEIEAIEHRLDELEHHG